MTEQKLPYGQQNHTAWGISISNDEQKGITCLHSSNVVERAILELERVTGVDGNVGVANNLNNAV